MAARRKLIAIKVLHTVVWAMFVGCILAVPTAAHVGRFGVAAACAAAVLVEVVILLLNRWRCPLTDLAARYTDERRDNFDIYLPAWVARYNKQIFGGLFVLGSVYAALVWWV